MKDSVWAVITIGLLIIIGILVANFPEEKMCWCDTSENVKVVYDVSKCPEREEVNLSMCSEMLREANEEIIKAKYYFEKRR